MDTNLILAIAQIVAVAVIPLIVWWMGILWQKSKTKNDAKQALFLTLMANRKATPNKEWVDALNTIDIVFQDNKKVRRAWREYYDSLDPSSQYNKDTNAFKLDLLSEMANALGYNDLKQTEIDRFYLPNYFSQLQQTQNLLAQESLRVLSHSKANAVAFTEEEYQEHKKKLGLKDE